MVTMGRSLTALRWALAMCLGGQALVLAVRVLMHHGQPVLLCLGLLETAGAALLLVPATRRVGAPLLLASLAIAAALHLASREAPPVAFLVYVPAIVVATLPTDRSSDP
jgi:hypothetical protein